MQFEQIVQFSFVFYSLEIEIWTETRSFVIAI